MVKVFSDVQIFMQAAGQSVYKNNDEQATLYHRLINEEYSEFISARIVKDEVETIDACFDMIWVIVGYMLSKGWDCEKIWDEGALSNLTKIDSVTGKVLKRDDGKVLKPEGWQPPDFTKFVLAQPVDAVNMSQNRVDETVKREHDRTVELVQTYERGWNAALAQTAAEEALDRMVAENQRLGLYDDNPVKRDNLSWVEEKNNG